MVGRTNERDYVEVFKGNPGACWSYIGRLGRGEQQLSLGAGCVQVGVVVHEFMHAIGKARSYFLKFYVALTYYTKYVKWLIWLIWFIIWLSLIHISEPTRPY